MANQILGNFPNVLASAIPDADLVNIPIINFNEADPADQNQNMTPTQLALLLGASASFSSLSNATAINSLDNTTYTQQWDWTGMTNEGGLWLNTNSLTDGWLLRLRHTTSVIPAGGTVMQITSTGVDTATFAGSTGYLLTLQGSNSTVGTGFYQKYDELLSGVGQYMIAPKLTTGQLLSLAQTTGIIANGGTMFNINSAGVNTSTTTGGIANWVSSGSTAGTQFLQTYSALTIGIGQSIVANALTAGQIMSITSTSTAASGSTQKGLYIALNAAGTATDTNGTSTFGLDVINGNDGTTSGHRAIRASVVGGTQFVNMAAEFIGSAGGGLLFGDYDSSRGAIWSKAVVTRGTANYMIRGDDTLTVLNAVTTVQIRISDSGTNQFNFNATGMSVGSPTPVSKFGVLIAPTPSNAIGLICIGSGSFAGGVGAGVFGLNGTTSSGNGTHIAINAASGYTGDLVNFQVYGVSMMRLTGAGLLGLGITPTTNLHNNGGTALKVTVSSAATLAIDVSSTGWTFTGTTTTWTIDTASASNKDWVHIIKNRGSGNITLNSTVGSDIYTTSAQSTITITPGQGVILQCDGTYWNVIHQG